MKIRTQQDILNEMKLQIELYKTKRADYQLTRNIPIGMEVCTIAGKIDALSWVLGLEEN